MPGTLILCATPIGNLDDVSNRLARTLANCDLIYCEDTRRSRILLRALGIEKPLRSYFVGNEQARQSELLESLKAAKTVCLLTDAGVPAIADPGWSAVNAAREAGAAVTIVPGPSALTAGLAVSGFPTERAVFEGFLPRRGQERKRRLDEISAESRTVVMFVGAAHLHQDLIDLARLQPQRPICIARELTKKFEEVMWMTCAEAAEAWSGREAKGEFTLILSAVEEAKPDLEEAVAEVLVAVANGGAMTTTVRTVAAEQKVSRRRLYEAVLARTRDTSPEP
jgi:16S rRNA (cytidine1402-2'-O)-methyltransferase